MVQNRRIDSLRSHGRCLWEAEKPIAWCFVESSEAGILYFNGRLLLLWTIILSICLTFFSPFNILSLKSRKTISCLPLLKLLWTTSSSFYDARRRKQSSLITRMGASLKVKTCFMALHYTIWSSSIYVSTVPSPPPPPPRFFCLFSQISMPMIHHLLFENAPKIGDQVGYCSGN